METGEIMGVSGHNDSFQLFTALTHILANACDVKVKLCTTITGHLVVHHTRVLVYVESLHFRSVNGLGTSHTLESVYHKYSGGIVTHRLCADFLTHHAATSRIQCGNLEIVHLFGLKVNGDTGFSVNHSAVIIAFVSNSGIDDIGFGVCTGVMGVVSGCPTQLNTVVDGVDVCCQISHGKRLGGHFIKFVHLRYILKDSFIDCTRHYELEIGVVASVKVPEVLMAKGFKDDARNQWLTAFAIVLVIHLTTSPLSEVDVHILLDVCHYHVHKVAAGKSAQTGSSYTIVPFCSVDA